MHTQTSRPPLSQNQALPELLGFLSSAALAARRTGDEEIIEAVEITIAVTAKAAWELDDLTMGVRVPAAHAHHSVEDLKKEVSAGIRLIKALLIEG